jgi:hypothetical protein
MAGRETGTCAEQFFFGPPLLRGTVTVGLRNVTLISYDFKNAVTLGAEEETVGLTEESVGSGKVTLGLSHCCLNVTRPPAIHFRSAQLKSQLFPLPTYALLTLIRAAGARAIP